VGRFTTGFVTDDYVYVVGNLAGYYSYTSQAQWDITLPVLAARAMLSPAEADRFKSKAQKPNVVDHASWQKSLSVSISLFVQSKYNDLVPYNAIFVVTGPDGKQYKVEKRNEGGGTGALFPDDFIQPSASPRSGKYSWKYIVRGRVAVGGDFDYEKKADSVTIMASSERLFWGPRPLANWQTGKRPNQNL
jgi:hypothetical protein